MKHQEPFDNWEKELHRELMGLPELEAPSTLISGVMRRIPAASVWYHSSWWHWPLPLRAASVVLVVSVLSILGWVSGSFGQLGLGPQLMQAWAEVNGLLAFLMDTGESLLGSNAEFWRQHGQMILIAAASLMLGTYLSCVAAGTALYRLAWRRTL